MRKYWIFQANPDYYKVEERLQQCKPQIITWSVNQHGDEIKEGDLAFVWICKGSKQRGEQDAGFAAALEVLCDPAEMHELPFEQCYYREPNPSEQRPKKRVICRILSTGWVTWPDMLESAGDLKELQNLRMTQGTNYYLDEQQARVLKELMPVS